MDINAANGHKIVFSHPSAGNVHHQETAAKFLEEGREYTVHYIDIGAWHTYVYIKEIPFTAFSSVMFDNATI